MSTPKAFNDEGIQFAWDQTSLGYAMTCLQKYDYVMLQGWKSQAPNEHLTFGAAYATALEHYHKHRAVGMEYDEAVYEVVREALIATAHYDEEGKFLGVWESTHNTKTRPNLIRTIVWYLEQFKDDPCKTVILSNGEAAVEHSFALPVDNGIVLTGHLDRLIDYSEKIYIQDQKSTGTTVTPYYFQQYMNDCQMQQYSFAGKVIFNAPISGVMVDAAQIAVGFTRFERGFIPFSEDKLNEWYDTAMHHIEVAQAATREQNFPQNYASCNNYGGCAFRGICSKSPKVREQYLKADFVKGKRWDPLEVR